MKAGNKILIFSITAAIVAVIVFFVIKNSKIKTLIFGEMNLNSKVFELIKKHESFRSKMYYDTGGLPTIGYGTLIDKPDEQYLKTAEITKEQGFALMQKDLKPIYAYVNSFVGLNENQKAALISFIYNVGISQANKSTLIKLVRENPENPKIKDEFSRWVYDEGKKITGLVNRRKDEANFYFS